MSERVSERLAELGRRTDALRPRAGFSARVMAALAADAAGAALAFRRELASSARWFMPLALLLALVSLGWASRAEGPSSAAFAEAERRLELEW